jgi:hypothetical protein
MKCDEDNLDLWVIEMSYKKGADGKWIGYCDGCKLPFQPEFVESDIKHEDGVIGFCCKCAKKGKIFMVLYNTANRLKTKTMNATYGVSIEELIDIAGRYVTFTSSLFRNKKK